MRRSAALAVAMLFAATGSVRADEPGAWGASATLRVGSVAAPFFTEALSEVSSEFTQARLLVVEGTYQVARRLTVGGRLPAAPSTVRQPAGSYSDEKAFGNPELFVEDRTLSRSLAGVAVRAAARIGVGIPLAEHGSRSSLLQNRVVALSSALDGWRNPELYEPGVIPIALSARAVIDPSPWGASASAKLPVMVRISDASLPSEADTRAIGIVPHVELRGTFRPLGWLELDAGAFVVVQARAPVAPSDRSARSGSIQLGIEPRIRFHISDDIALHADFNAALGGPLSGTYGIGLGLGIER